MKKLTITMKKLNLLSMIIILTTLSFMSCKTVEQKDLSLPPFFSDHMVLQQNEKVVFWGLYTPKEKVIVKGSWGEEVFTVSDDANKWKLQLPTPEAGGPYEVSIITADTTIVFKDVMVGEVWLASGQSNMEMPVTGFLPNEPVDNFREEIARAIYPKIRMFTVASNFTIDKQDSLGGDWQVCSPETVGKFSASAYFFARKLHKELNIPIGIIHSSWGGTVAEAWTSKSGLKDFPEFIKTIESYDDTTVVEWARLFEKTPVPASLEELEKLDLNHEQIADPQFDDINWPKMNLPAENCHTDNFLPNAVEKEALHGVFWYRKKIKLKNIENDYTLTIGGIDDGDITYVNGHKVGSTFGWQDKRIYRVPKSILKKGENTIAFSQYDGGGGSGIVGPLYLEDDNGGKISLEGSWSGLFYADVYDQKLLVYGLNHQEKLNQRPFIPSEGPNKLPSSLFNAMINPLIPYKIKGAIWYQGESNVDRSKQYEKLFPAMITDWRSYWRYDFPFYYVQIAPFTYGNELSPELRDAQRRSLKTKNTGMAITMDIGHASSIHPGNKQDVGDRLARLALANDYTKDIIASGPLYKNHTVKGNTLIIEFQYAEGLTSKDSEFSGFEIAGDDKVFVPSTATIVDNKVEVAAANLSNPKYVRYAWKDYFEGTLFNKAGLPASSFTSEY